MKNKILLVGFLLCSVKSFSFEFNNNGALIGDGERDKIKDDKTLVFKSLRSNICHSIKGGYRDKVNIFKNGFVWNVYKNLDSCLADGGLANKYEKKLLEEEDPAEAVERDGKDAKAAIENQYNGLNFGGGIMFANYAEEVVLDASIENGAVSVNHEINNRAVAMLESHYFFTPGPKNILGIGPFIGIGLAGEDGVDPLSIYGVGFMMGFRKENSTSSWNVGVGYFVDSEATILKQGFAHGGATQETDSAKITRKDDIGGVMLMFSQSF